MIFFNETNCQARVPGLTDWMDRDLRVKLKSQRETQKGTRADAIIQIHPPTTTTTTITFQSSRVSMSFNIYCLVFLSGLTLLCIQKLSLSRHFSQSKHFSLIRHFSLSRHSSLSNQLSALNQSVCFVNLKWRSLINKDDRRPRD